MSTPSREQQLLASLQQSATVIQKLKAQLRGYNEPIAVIGMGCRFPGHSDNPAQFWQMLAQGVDAVVAMPEARRSRPESDPHRPPCYGGFLADVEGFDPAFFGISPRETNLMDPQQRLLLEVSWEALESAAIVPESLFKSNTGVFIGMCNSDYAALAHTPMLLSAQDELHRLTGMSQSVAAGRLAYWFGFTGPAMVVDTACSSSLVTTHQACQSLRQRECDLALAGGVNLLLSDHWATFGGDSEERMLAWDGRCKTFDAAANGFGRGEGCGIVVLKRLAEAQADGNRILAVIRGSMINQDGRSSGLSAPSGPSQQRVIRQALQKAEVEPDQVSYIEAHGTGTRLGDPIEIGALNAVFGQASTSSAQRRKDPLWVGSVKTNFGHLEGAAGIAGLIKIILAFQHNQLPPHLNFHHPNPYIDWDGSPVQVGVQLQPWVAAKKIAGVSSFGISGTNAHVILEAAPPEDKEIGRQGDKETGGQGTFARTHELLTISAKSEAALRAYVQRYLDFLAAEPEVELGDLCYTSHVGRTHFAHRLTLTAASIEELQVQCRAYLNPRPGQAYPGMGQGVVTAQPTTPKVAFLFTGQGAQYVNMGRALYETEPIFRAALDRCDELLRPALGISLLAVLYPETVDSGQATGGYSRRVWTVRASVLTPRVDSGQWAGDTRHETRDTNHGHASVLAPRASRITLDDTTYTQPALFALEYALATLWQAWGVQPAILIGHSVGEIAAACVAGVFSLEDGLRLIAARGWLMGALPQDGAMVSVLADEKRVAQAIAPYTATVSIAALNGPESVVISGAATDVTTIAQQLGAEGIKTRPLTVSHAFHSGLMTPMLDAFRAVAAGITYHVPTLPLVSNLTGKLAGAEIATPDYWVRHVREAVRFGDGVQTLYAHGATIFLEIGPKPVLLGMIATPSQPPPVQGRSSHASLPSLRENHPDWQQLLTSLGELYGQGVTIDWAAVDQGQPRRKIELPTYPFQRQRYWLDVPKPATYGAIRPMIDHMARLPLHDEILLEIEFSEARLPFLVDHQFYGLMVSPAACQLSIALSAAELIFGQQQGLQVEDFILPQALSLFPGEVRAVQAIFSPAVDLAGSKQAFKFISFEPLVETVDPMSHGSGYIGVEPATVPPTVDIATLRQRPAEAVDMVAYYGAMEPTATYIGPAFRWISELWRLQNETTMEAFAHLTLPQPIGTVVGHLLHPGLLDGCFQVAAWVDPQNEGRETVSVLFAVQRVRLYRAAQGNSWWCHALKGELNRWAILLFDDSGQLFASFEQVEIREANMSAIRGKELWRNWLYQIAWRPQPVTPASALVSSVTRPAAGEYSHLIFADRQGVGAALARQLQAQGGQPRLLFADGAEQEWLTGLTPASTIIHLWSLDIDQPTAGTPLVAASLPSWGSALDLVQALLRQGTTPSALWFVTQSAQPVLAGDRIAGFMQAPLWGMGKTIALEHPELGCGLIDLDAHLDPTAQATQLYAEITAAVHQAERETQVAFRGTERYVARLAAYQPGAPTQALKIQGGATYLITGGLGALGLVVAQWLAEQGAQRLLLVGRRAPTPTAEAVITLLRAKGVTVIVAQADVADWAQVAALTAQMDAAYPLRGVIHAAGQLDDGIVLQQSQARFATVLAAKMQGAWHLQQLVAHLTETMPDAVGAGGTLDFFVAFSSLTSLLGNPGQANYGAANAFLDAFAHYQRSQGISALSINWGAWAEAGMAARLADGQPQALGGSPFGTISPQHGLAALAYLLNQPVAQVGVTPIQWAKLQAQLAPGNLPGNRFYADFWAQATPSTTVGLVNVRQQLLAAQQEKRAEEFLFDYLRLAVAQILGLPDPEQLEPHQGLLDIGLDSLMAVELRNRLSNTLAAQLPSTLIFDYPTLAKLTGYLLQELLPPLDAAVENAALAVPAGQGSPTTMDDTLAALSADEITSIADELELLNDFLTTPRRTGNPRR